MSKSSGYSELAGSLATVAIAALGGPLAAGGAALTQVVRYTQARYEAGEPTRDLRRQVTREISQWAKGEGFAQNDVELGLALATKTVTRFGLDVAAIATLQFDPAKAKSRVLEAAQGKDPYWGKEPHYDVAERGI